MRLLSLTVRNYRAHRECSIEFDPARNLLGGPNESGKSTLVEAAHRVLFLRAKTGGNVQAEMVSSVHHGVPEVVLAFEAGGERWDIEKRFAGAKGTARLTGPCGAVFKDDEAESKLAGLLKTEIAGGRGAASQLPSLWGHLWVWQGSSGYDPGQHAAPFKDDLARRLQQDGLGAAMQSAADQQVRERIGEIHDTLFTATGKPRVGSPPERAREEWEVAVSAHQAASDAVARLEAAISDHSSAERQLAEADGVLPGLRAEKAKVDGLLGRVSEFRREEETCQRAWETASTALKQLTTIDSQIRELIGQSEKFREALQPAEEKEAGLVAAEQEARAACDGADENLRQTSEALSRARLHHDLATAWVTAFEKSEAHRALAARLAEVTAIGNERSGLLESIWKIAPISPKDVQVLRKLDRDASQAAASLDAMAAGIELVRSDALVTLDGRALVAGESHILTDAGELAIGPGTLIRIRPGGGNSLADARAQAEKSRRALADELARHALSDPDQATARLERRQALEQHIAQLDARWKAMSGDTLVAEVSTSELARDAAQAEVERRREIVGRDLAVPQGQSEALSLHSSSAEALRQAEAEETACRRLDGELRTRLATASGALKSHRDQLVADRQALRDLETRIQVLEDSHGDASGREAALIQSREVERQASLDLAAVRMKLAELSPDQLAADQKRYQRAIAQQETRLRDAEDQRLTARTRLHLDGSSDPHADLSHTTARVEATRTTYESEHRRAQAIAKLHQLFASSREAIDRNLVQPLADRIAGYLQCLYGPGTAVQVALSDDGIAGLELFRPGAPAFAFATLSGGAREQVAAAVRLAVAEILSEDHDGCLPLVFDDAFAYSDPDRIQVLQRMLDVASGRGLQLIVLTCTPSDYSSLGASERRMS